MLEKNIRHTHRGLRPLCDSAAMDVFRKLRFRDILGCGLWPRLRNSQKPCVLLLITVRSADSRSNIACLVKNIRHTPRGLRPLCDSAARDVFRKLRFRDILGCGLWPRLRNSQKPCRLLLVTVRSADNRSNTACLVKNIRHTPRGLRPLCDSAARDVFRKLCFRDIPWLRYLRLRRGVCRMFLGRV